jgi:hypothetical protein
MSSVTGQPHGNPIANSPARSAPVSKATTPGSARAAALSIAPTRAWARGLRSTAMWSVPAGTMSSVHVARPVISAASSRRGTLCPTKVEVSAVWVIWCAPSLDEPVQSDPDHSPPEGVVA